MRKHRGTEQTTRALARMRQRGRGRRAGLVLVVDNRVPALIPRCSHCFRVLLSRFSSHPNDAIYIRTVNQHEVLPKQRQAGIVSAAATTVKK